MQALSQVSSGIPTVNDMGNQVPADTFNTCCVCGMNIEESDYRAGGLHDGHTYVDGKPFFVHRQTHRKCQPKFKKLLW